MQGTITDLFDQPITYPDSDYNDRLNYLVGLDDHKSRLVKIISLLVNPGRFDSWLKKHHPDATDVLHHVLRRPPLIVLAGDVGSGKSELALTIGDAVARQEKIDVILFPLSLSARGQGRVGEMTQLVSAAFAKTIDEAQKLQRSKGAVLLLIDEADALAQSRESGQMHHEDKAGVNAFIRGIDSIANKELPVAVLMCTNRLGALDPAVKRRAAEILSFSRPNDLQRSTVLSEPLRRLGLRQAEIRKIVAMTGAGEGRPYGFSFSDLTQRLIPSIVLSAYPDHAVDATAALSIAKNLVPTPPFKETQL